MREPDIFTSQWRKSSHSDSGQGECVEVATVWRKSSRSESQQGACVAVAAVWRKSSHSDSQAEACVEVARADRLVAVRDSKNPDGPVLAFTPTEWLGLLSGIKTGTVPG